MASKKQKKGKTMPLTDFLAAEPKLVTVRATNWSEIVDSEEQEVKPIVVDIGVLPTAPRSAHDFDFSTVPNNPPFVAHVANLSFEVDDEGLRRIFADLNPKTARVLRDGMRSRGLGLVEFETRENLIEALKKSDKEVYGRKIRINVSDKNDSHTDSGRGTFGSNRSHRSGGGEERPEMADRWKRAEPRPDETSDDRPSSGFNRDRQNRGDHGRSTMGGSSRDNQQGNDYGFGYPRTRDDRGGGGGGGNRDYNRQGQRNRYQDDTNRSNSGADRPRYAGRYSDTRDTRDRNRPSDDTHDDQQEPPRERQRLQLQKRTKPLEENQPLSGSSSSLNNIIESSISNPDEASSAITNKSIQQTQDLSINENQDESEQQQSRDSNDNTSRANTSDEQSTAKPSRGAGASIFGGAKPVDTTARELEIERKIKELQMTTTETSADNEDKGTSSRPSYNRGSERDVYRSKRSTQNDDGRSGHGVDYHHKREFSGGRQYEDEGRRRNDDNYRRGGGSGSGSGGGGHDRDRYGGPSRRDYDSGRKGKYNHHSQPERDNERGNYRPRDRDDRNQDTNEYNNPGRSSNTNVNTEPQSRNQPRGTARRTVKTEDDSQKLQLSNKFGMLDDDELDDENDDAKSPTIDD
ncbi:unnamed protein product [Rotaria sp. Silwood1]|nr:unnamed protein product [Rotaria sp. Silwood1]CAF3323520.1 unnamed protein product [Rotaria sp. Silwood1]CAF4551129.1 unnamed protein product [Rotaria sp. Silwood1]CAF4749308.1 unnamed protein product [Rotaria sp. Silwood1]